MPPCLQGGVPAVGEVAMAAMGAVMAAVMVVVVAGGAVMAAMMVVAVVVTAGAVVEVAEVGGD